MLWLRLLVAVMGLLIFGGMYALLGRSRRRCDAAWRELRERLTRRAGLAAELLAALRDGAALDAGALAELQQAGDERAPGQHSPREQARLEARLGEALKFVAGAVQRQRGLAENEPLKRILEKLTREENRVQAAVLTYNETVKKHDHKVHYLPWNLFAAAYGFRDRERFGL